MSRTTEGFLWRSSNTKKGLTTDACISSTPSGVLKPSYDVIVIGAGFAGLIAARDLSKENLSVLLIEGRDRIGGRTWTAKELGEEFEMGGTWVHWNQPHVYAELSRYGLHSALKTSAGTLAPAAHFYKPPSPSRDATTTSANTAVPNEVLETPAQAVADAFFAVDGLDSHALLPYPHDPFRPDPATGAPQRWRKYDGLSIKDRLDQMSAFKQEDKDVFETFMSSLGSAGGAEIGFTEALRWYALAGHSMAAMFESAGLFKLGKGGMTAFAKKVFAEFRGDVVAGAVVSSVEQVDGKGVTVVAKDGREFKAGRVVCTIPLNCLSDITFTPPLSPLKREAIRHGQPNQGAKIHFQLSTNPAPEPSWFALASPHSDSPWCFSFSDHNGTSASTPQNTTYAIGFGYNARLPADASAPGAPRQIVESFTQHLRPADLKGKTEVKAFLTHAWHEDPLAKGVWSCWGKGAMTRYLEELQRPHGRVVFASADWADGWRGFVDGAIERGCRAAREVVEGRRGGEDGWERARL